MVQIQLMGRTLDTRREADHNAIVDATGLDSTLSLEQFTKLQKDLEELGIGRTSFETQLLGDVQRGVARMADADYVYQRASQGGIWAAARIMQDGQTLLATEAYASGKQNGAYSLDGDGVGNAELEASQSDSEVGVLDALSDWFSSQLSSRNGQRLHVIFSGSMGPCLGCQGRIRKFLLDLNAIACNVGVNIPLIFEVNATTRTQTPEGGLLLRRTQYGYTKTNAYTFANSGTGLKGYWSKVFLLTLGAKKPPTITENPS